MLRRTLTMVAWILVGLIIMGSDCPTKPEVGDIAGKVIDSITEEALSGVTVSTEPVTKSVLTNSEGEFTIPDVEVGEYLVKYHKDGYQDDEQEVFVKKNEVAACRLWKWGLSSHPIQRHCGGTDHVRGVRWGDEIEGFEESGYGFEWEV